MVKLSLWPVYSIRTSEWTVPKLTVFKYTLGGHRIFHKCHSGSFFPIKSAESSPLEMVRWISELVRFQVFKDAKLDLPALFESWNWPTSVVFSSVVVQTLSSDAYALFCIAVISKRITNSNMICSVSVAILVHRTTPHSGRDATQPYRQLAFWWGDCRMPQEHSTQVEMFTA